MAPSQEQELEASHDLDAARLVKTQRTGSRSLQLATKRGVKQKACRKHDRQL